MAAYLGKYHIALASQGYILARNRNGQPYYQKKKAPAFVNKFGSGDSSYRDASFWQFWAQTNWRNGAKQLRLDDPGKFWKSSNINITQLDELTLSKDLTLIGQLASGIKVNAIAGWRPAAGSTAFGNGTDGALTVSSNTTEAPIDSAATATAGSTTISATNASFAAAQKILIIQMDGANAGKYEIRTISAYTAGTITTTEALTNTYTSKAQVRVLKQYSSVTINASVTYTAKAWDGTVGGILAFLCNGTVTVAGTISANGAAATDQTGASGGGFRGGDGLNNDTGGGSGMSGEGTGGASVRQVTANGNGGGGGNLQSDSGAGGGGHAAAGTDGTRAVTLQGGIGGSAVGVAALTTVFMGGGGGGAHYNGSTTQVGGGGSGGGIIHFWGTTLTVTGAITANGGAGVTLNGKGGGGGAGGSILLKAQIATLGSALITATGGAGGADSANAGGAGAVGRIHLDYLTSYAGTTSPTLDYATDNTLADSPPTTSFKVYAGGSDGGVYLWNDVSSFSESFNVHWLTRHESGNDTDMKIGDVGGTETAQAQSFQIGTTAKVKAVDVYLKKNAGTPTDITVRIETNNVDKPSGTLADANATVTIPAFTTATYGWIRATFNTSFSLTASTTYWLVLKIAAGANDNNYAWAADGSSPTYSSGNNAASADGGSTWTADTAKDMYFRIRSEPAQVNDLLVTSVGSTRKMLIAAGEVSDQTSGNARIFSFDGTTWALEKTFTTATESAVLKLWEYNSKLYASVGPQAKIYEGTAPGTWTLSKDIDIPQNPGYAYALKEYNGKLYAGGGAPEFTPSNHYNGFWYYFDGTTWQSLYPFDFTELKCFEFYDSFLFGCTYHGHIYVFDTATLNPLFNFKDIYGYSVSILAAQAYDDKIYFLLYPQDSSGETNVGVWCFDRHGLSQAFVKSGVTGYRCAAVVNNLLLIGTGDNGNVYKVDATNYAAQGWLQSSYFDANLPSINKLYNSIELQHDPLVSGQSIVVYYKFKESDSWTTLGTSDTVSSTSKTLSFASGTVSKKISLKIELNTTTVTGTPKVKEIVMQYSLLPATKWLWTMRVLAKKSLQLLDKTTESRSATTIRSDIETAQAAQQLQTFVDIDGTSYTVLFSEIDQASWVVNQDDVNEDEIAISLLQA